MSEKPATATDYLIHREVCLADWQKRVYELERKTDAKSVSPGQPGKQPVVIALATPQTVVHPIESHTWHNSQIYSPVVREKLTFRLHDAVSSLAQVLLRCISAQFHVLPVNHFRQQNGLARQRPSREVTEKDSRIDLVGQGVIEQYGPGLPPPGMMEQTPDYKFRQLPQLIARITVFSSAHFNAPLLFLHIAYKRQSVLTGRLLLLGERLSFLEYLQGGPDGRIIEIEIFDEILVIKHIVDDMADDVLFEQRM